MKKIFRVMRLTAMVFLAHAAQADIIQGTVTEAGKDSPLEGVKVASDSMHAVFTGSDGKFALDTQKGSTGLVPQKSRPLTANHSMPAGRWAWYNLLGRPIGAQAALYRITNPAQANANPGGSSLAKSSASQAMNSLSFRKAGYLPMSMDVDGSRSDVKAQMQAVPIGGDADAWYEAEASANILFNILGAGGRTKCSTTCTGSPKEGDACCMGGYKITQLLGRCDTRASSANTKACRDDQGPGGAGVTFVGVKVPKAGTYDITWWYHAGGNDNWNDHDCGGKPAPVWMTYFNPNANPQPGCRPHLIAVNGKEVDGPKGERYWQFPVFGGSWDILHAATTTLTLAEGINTVQLAAPRIGDLDAVDIDAIHVQAADRGNLPKVVAPTVYAGDGRK